MKMTMFQVMRKHANNNSLHIVHVVASSFGEAERMVKEHDPTFELGQIIIVPGTILVSQDAERGV